MRRELRFGVRALGADPAFTTVAVLCMALGIGAVVVVFTIVNAVVFRPLPVAEPDRVVMMRDVNRPRGNWRPPTLRTLREWREHSRAFAGFAHVRFSTESLTLTSHQGSEQVTVQWVGPELFPLLGIEPADGRFFGADDPRDESGELETILISAGFRARQFADEEVLGRTVRIRGRERTIVGVVPAGFYLAPFTGRVDVFAAIDPALRPPDERLPIGIIGRVAAGYTHEQAAAEADALARAIEPAEPELNYHFEAPDLLEFFSAEAQPTFTRLLVTVVLLLLVACVNVAALLMSRTARRQREIATRAALGATRSRLVVEVLSESALLAAAGAVAGLLASLAGVRAFAVYAGFRFPPEILTVDPTVLAVAVGAAFGSAVLFGALPSLTAARADVGDALRGLSAANHGRSGPRIRGLLLVSELALAQILLINAGLTINSLFRVLALEPGFDPASAFTATFRLESPRYVDAHDNTVTIEPDSEQFWSELLRAVRAHPDVEAAALTSQLPGRLGRSHAFDLLSASPPEDAPGRAPYYAVSADYFGTMRIPVLAGRAFDATDRRESEPVAIVNEPFARELFGDASPIGHTIRVRLQGSQGGDLMDAERTIVGVVGGVRHILRIDPMPMVYVPDTQHLASYPADDRQWLHLGKGLVARTSGSSRDIGFAVREAVDALDPEVAVADAQALLERLQQTAGAERSWVRLYAPFAALSLLLASIGVYGLVSHSVAHRTREFGVRLALGAESSRVLRLVQREATRLAGIGLMIGAAGAITLNRVIANRLYAVTATDPATHVVVAAVLMLAVIGAAWLPARRATRVSPVEALRAD